MSGLSVLLVAVALGIPSDEPTDSGTPEACGVAAAAESYPDDPVGPAVPEELKARIRRYRRGWVQFCRGRSPSSLSDLLRQAKEIEEAFSMSDRDECWCCFLVYERLQSFVPAFSGSCSEIQLFDPSFPEFQRQARRGTPEDRRFFADYARVVGEPHFPLWRHPITDYSACDGFGEYDWVKALRVLDALDVSVRSPVYHGLVRDARLELLEVLIPGDYLLESSSAYCACGSEETMLSDLERVQAYMRNKARYTNHLRRLRRMLTAIREKKIEVRANCLPT